jgi:hypothetical protein
MDPLWPPPLLDSRSPAARVLVVVVTPVAFGVLCGVMLGVSAAVYLVLTLPIAIAGGFLAGLEHTSPREAARRGVLGGALFGSTIVVVHAIIGNKAKVDPPSGDPARGAHRGRRLAARRTRRSAARAADLIDAA